jgi:hypothetical protein
MSGRRHLADSLRWSTETEVEAIEVLSAGLGMAGPIAFAALAGHLPLGAVAAIGSFAVGGVSAAQALPQRFRALIVSVVPPALAGLAAIAIAGLGAFTSIAIVVLAAVAATVGGYSRPMAVATTRFVLFLLIAINFVQTTPYHAAAVGLMAAGALWAFVLNLGLGVVMRSLGLIRVATAAAEAPQPTAAQKRARWQRSLRDASGWQYAVRLTVCLAIGEALSLLWPEHHLYWVTLTVALLTERPLEAVPVKTTQRALGTTIGVALSGLIISYRPPAWGIVLVIGAFAGARPLLRARNYFAYSILMTPLIILIMDFSAQPDASVLIDRLMATLIAVALVITANLLAGRALRHGAG